MKTVLAFVVGTAFVAAIATPMLAQMHTTTVTGEVVDIACAVKKTPPGKGEAHADCTTDCIKKGQPAGLLTDDAVYTITGDYAANKNAKLVEFVAKKVEVTGEVTEKDGQKTINVKSIKRMN